MVDKSQYSTIRRLLNELDWDCNDQIHHHASLSRIHWYPASFITAIPGNLIDIFTDEEGIIWDPFCGSGTSAVEAFRKGRHFYGTDICHLAIDVTRAKINAIQYRDELQKFMPTLTEELKSIEFGRKFGLDTNNYLMEGKRIVSFEELQPWYSHDVLKQLLILRGILETKLIPKSFNLVFKVIFLNIAKLACAQQKTWGHIADNVQPKPKQIQGRQYDVIPNYLARVEQIIERAHRIHIVSGGGDVKAVIADSRKWLPPEPVDLVVTSPPYPHMADYVTSQRLSYYWLGYDKEIIEHTKRTEIGARWLRHNSQKNEIYFRELLNAFSNIIASIKHNGILAIMLPDFDQDDPRSNVISQIYNFLEDRLSEFYKISRHLNELYRWAPFRKLKDETLSIWVMK